MFERIVLAVDGSEPAQRAVPVAADSLRSTSEVIAVTSWSNSRAGRPIAFQTTKR
jgi:nucleotide-binding universal stress UspA family protein